MRKLLTLVALCTATNITVAQTTMNIYQNNGSVIQIQINTIDSITYTVGGFGGIPDYLNPNLTYGNVTDQSGNAYATIVIGTQEWMAENLRNTSYANGDPIPNVTSNSQWDGLTSGAWAHFNNDNQYDNTYGKLYNWYAVSDPRNVCPTGWHVPTDAEWGVLCDYLDPVAGEGGTTWETIAGGKMKSTGTQYWESPNAGSHDIGDPASNESGFSGLPGATRGGSGEFTQVMGSQGYWWTATVAGNVYVRQLFAIDGRVNRTSLPFSRGLSVRCVKD